MKITRLSNGSYRLSCTDTEFELLQHMVSIGAANFAEDSNLEVSQLLKTVVGLADAHNEVKQVLSIDVDRRKQKNSSTPKRATPRAKRVKTSIQD